MQHSSCFHIILTFLSYLTTSNLAQDGGEWNNSFLYNLGAKTRRLPANTPRAGESDHAPSTFWITNPANHWVGNVAAGSADKGFWFELKLRGQSASLGECISLYIIASFVAHLMPNRSHVEEHHISCLSLSQQGSTRISTLGSKLLVLLMITRLTLTKERVSLHMNQGIQLHLALFGITSSPSRIATLECSNMELATST